MRYIIGDTETTGLGPTRKAVEVALMEVHPETLEVLGAAESIINPEKPIDPSATAIHGITDDQVKDAPTMAQFIERAFGGPLSGELVLLGYRVGFDLPMLKPIGNIVKAWDVLVLAQTLVTDSENHKLQTLREHFQLPGGPAHRAMGDVMTTHQLLQLLLPWSGRSLEAHCSTPFQVVHRQPWGKHEGTPLILLPSSYKRWLLSLPDLEPNLRRSLEMFIKTDRTL